MADFQSIFDFKIIILFLGKLFGGNSEEMYSKMRNILSSKKEESTEMKSVLKRLEDIKAELAMAINGKGCNIPVKPEELETPKEAILEKVHDSFDLEESSGNKNSFWIENIKKEFETDALGEGKEKKLKDKELKFWDGLIAEFLKPLVQTKEVKADLTNDLKVLRNKITFYIVMINCIIVLVIFLLQLHMENLSFTWPFPKQVCRNYSQYSVNIKKNCLHYSLLHALTSLISL